jgi:hypothetical protein
MRRLAKQSRKDTVLSKRDYQTITEVNTAEVLFKKAGQLSFSYRLSKVESEFGLVGIGAFLSADHDINLGISVTQDGNSKSETGINIGKEWTRFGKYLSVGQDASEVRVTMSVDKACSLFIWGLNISILALPEKIKKSNPTEEILSQIHLMPETLYLSHASAIDENLTISDLKSCVLNAASKRIIHLKKCAYCQRKLPLDPKKPGVLSFHKHNAKISGHQNECRACKKWRINDSFNPLRTVDQLHESSVITRERSLFLREPEILQKIKDRQGAGLKGIIWERFGRKCFRCKKPLQLKEVHLDHTRPMAYLYPIDEHATCLCAVCNNYKTDRFPVDAYTSMQLKELSKVTGLSLEQLTKKDVNEVELQRMINDIEVYARSWDPKAFAATARKIKEYRPKVDLFALLEAKDKKAYKQLMRALSERPDPVK